mgnify:CR=1 FL=1
MSMTESPDGSPPVDDAREELQDAVPKAAKKLSELLDAEDERIQIRAAEAILDRAGVVKAKRVSSSSASKKVGGEEPPSLEDMY